MESPLKLLLGAGTDQMAEDVLEVVDQDLSPVCLQLIGQSTDEGGASRARLSRQVGQEHLEGPLHVQVCIQTYVRNIHVHIHNTVSMYYHIQHTVHST